MHKTALILKFRLNEYFLCQGSNYPGSCWLPLNLSVRFNCSLLHVCVCAYVSHCSFIFCAIFVCTIDVYSYFILVERRLNLVGKSYH